MHCREILFTPRCNPRAREFPRSGQLFYTTYRASKSHGLHRRMIPIFLCGSRRSKGVPSATGDFLRLLVGELGTPKLAQIFAYGKWLYPYIMLLHGASDLDQRCLKTRNSEDECTFPPNIFPLPPKSPQNPILGDLSMRNLLYREPPSVAR